MGGDVNNVNDDGVSELIMEIKGFEVGPCD